MKHISKDQFIRNYAERSAMSVEAIMEHNVCLPCACGDSKCAGWAIVPNQEILIQSHNELYAPEQPKPGADQ